MSFLTAKDWEEPVMTQILIPLQGIPAEANIISLGFYLAESSKAQIMILHCKERFGKTDETILNSLLEHSQSLSKRLKVPFDFKRVKRVRASDAILKSSNDLGCDLVIMGIAEIPTHKHLLGSTVRRVARKSKVPVLAVVSWLNEFKDRQKFKIQKILLPIRKTSKDITALRLAAALKNSSAAQEAELIALNLTHFPDVINNKSLDTPEIKVARELFVDDITIFSEQTGLNITPKHVAAQKIGESALEIAAEEKSDLIILGAHRKPGRFGSALGSVSQEIASQAPTTVVITFTP
jgi:nucleotide-binding universal stress UspA family protein